jgi:hypothetical protein
MKEEYFGGGSKEACIKTLKVKGASKRNFQMLYKSIQWVPFKPLRTWLPAGADCDVRS